ncbi:MAG: class IV adenylate cyclase [bacterium]
MKLCSACLLGLIDMDKNKQEQPNIEIKARCANHAQIRKILKSKKAVFKGKDHQIDTYFKVKFGRLKLREGNIENCLIFYAREDKKGPKQSDYLLFKHDPRSCLKDMLIKSLGILAIVDKQREIYFIDNIKFHLDIVKNLGKFVEIEVIDNRKTSKDKLLKQCEYYLDLFQISKKDLISGSYSDLLLKTNTFRISN